MRLSLLPFLLVVSGLSALVAAAEPPAAAGPAAPAAGAPTAAADVKPRIGVYDARAVAIAYVRSNRDAEHLKKLQADLKQAEQAGKADRAADIRSQGERLQTLRHLQGFAGARIDDILPSLSAKLPQIAREAGVVAIVDKVDFAAPGVETIDLTDRIVAEFNPDGRTQEILAQLKAQKPLPMLDALAMKPTD